MTVATLPAATRPTSGASHQSNHHGRNHRKDGNGGFPKTTKFPSIVLPRPTMVTPDISTIEPRQRINVLRPPTLPNGRRTVALETVDAHHHMHKRCASMQRNQWRREHGEWQKPMYGSPEVKEMYRSQIRSTLKTQMDLRIESRKREWFENLNESLQVTERDRRDCVDDFNKRQAHFNFLVAFTKANKEMMESRWKEKQLQKRLEDQRDCEQLKFDPINWNKTLK